MDLDCSGLQSLEAANRCGMRNVPSAATTEADTRWFIKYVSMDLYGADHWYCSGLEQLNRYTFTGSYYYAYVKMASCSVPTGWRVYIGPQTEGMEHMLAASGPHYRRQKDGTDRQHHTAALRFSL